jgi:MFS family permease
MNPSPSARLGARVWSAIVVLGLAGQLAWTVENMYLNVFVYDTITDDPGVIALLVAFSAITATLATIVIGAWSDRTGRRRVFVAAGYVLWGLSTAAFGFVSPETAAALLPGLDAVTAAIVTIVLLDCLMSFLGSGANDAAFQAWVTDTTVPANRGRVDGVLSIMPLLGMLIAFGALDGLTRAGEWRTFFGVVGLATAVVGLIAAFTVRDRAPGIRDGGAFSDLIYGLRPSTVRKHPRLYELLVLLAVVGISTQVFLPFLIIYLQRTLRIDGYAIVLGVVLIVASVVSVLGGRVIDRVGKLRAILPSIGILAAGLIGMFFVRDMLGVIIAGSVMMSGFMLSFAAITATIRDHTPADRAGTVQGLRMIFAIMIPMILGPIIGASVIVGAGETYLDLGVEKQVPTAWIFIAAAAVLVFTVPLVAIVRRSARRADQRHEQPEAVER